MKQTAKHCRVDFTRVYCLELGLRGLTAHVQKQSQYTKMPQARPEPLHYPRNFRAGGAAS